MAVGSYETFMASLHLFLKGDLVKSSIKEQEENLIRQNKIMSQPLTSVFSGFSQVLVTVHFLKSAYNTMMCLTWEWYIQVWIQSTFDSSLGSQDDKVWSLLVGPSFF